MHAVFIPPEQTVPVETEALEHTGTDFVTFVINGMNQNVPSPVATTYTLNPDCTGTFSVHNGPNFNTFVAVDGSRLSLVGTDPGGADGEVVHRSVRLGNAGP